MKGYSRTEQLKMDAWRALHLGISLEDTQTILVQKYDEWLSPVQVALNISLVCAGDFCTSSGEMKKMGIDIKQLLK